MSDDEKVTKTRKEGLSDAARDAVERAKPMPHTPHGKEDIDASKKPSPRADSDDEAPLRTFHKIDPEDREKGDHRGAERGMSHPRGGPADDSREKARRPALLLAEYSSASACLHAAEKLRDAGYASFDTHTPFAVHGMDRAMGLPDSRLGWIVLACGLTGITGGFAMMYWMNCIDYPLVVGGKAPDISSIPSMIPIMFELTVLLSSFGAVLGMFHLNKLPRHHHPIFESDRFRAFSDDKFFVSVEVDDPKFKLDRTRELLVKTKADAVELVEEDE